MARSFNDVVKIAARNNKGAENPTPSMKSFGDILSTRKKYGTKYDIDENYLNSFQKDLEDYTKRDAGVYGTMQYGEYSSVIPSQLEKINDLSRRSRYIRSWINSGGSGYTNTDDMLKFLDQTDEYLGQSYKSYDSMYNYMSGFENEKDYNIAQNLGKLTSADIIKLQEQMKGDYNLIPKRQSSKPSKIPGIDSNMASPYDISGAKYAAQKHLGPAPGMATFAVEGALTGVIPSEEESYNSIYSKYGFSADTYDSDYAMLDSLYRQKQLAEIIADTPENILNGDIDRDATISALRTWDEPVSRFEDFTNKELAALLYAKNNGKLGYITDPNEAGANYSPLIRDIAEQRGTPFYDALNNTLLEPVFGAVKGFGDFPVGVLNSVASVLGGDPLPEKSIDRVYQKMQGDNTGLWKVVNDAVYTGGNMLPSILIGKWGAGKFGQIAGQGGNIPTTGMSKFVAENIGVASLGASAAGNAYSEMINLGYDKSQARNYGLLVGASEALLEKLLGGINFGAGKGGIASATVNTFINKIDNAIGRAAIALGANMVDEGIEEAVQTALEPYFKAFATGEDVENADWDEILYSALLGALMGGVFEGPSALGDAVSTARVNSAVNDAMRARYNTPESRAKLLDNILEMDESNKFASRLKEKTDGGQKRISVKNLKKLEIQGNKLFSEKLNRELSKSIPERLVELGADEATAAQVAPVILKRLQGETLTAGEEAIFDDSEIADLVYNETFETISDAIAAQELATSVENVTDGKTVVDGENAAQSENTGTSEPTVESLSKKYGVQAKAYTNAYSLNTSQSLTEFDRAYKYAYDMGRSGVSSSYVMRDNLPALSSLSKMQREIAYEAGKAVSAKPTRDATLGEGTSVKVKSIASIGQRGEGIKVRLEDGAVVGLRELTLSGGENLVFSAIAKMRLPLETANQLLDIFYDGDLSAIMFAKNAAEAYRAGMYGIPRSELPSGDTITKIYELGKENSAVDEDNKAAPKKSKKGKLHNSIAPQNELQRSSLKMLEVLADVLGIDIYTVESKTVNGKHVGKNGWFDPSNNSIYIDIFSGVDGKGAMLFTLAHELTHYIRANSPAKFKAFSDFLFEKYGEKGVSVSDRIEAKKKFLKKKGTITSKMSEAEAYDLAYEEVVANACESFLADGKAAEKIAELKTKDKGLWETIKDHITKLANKIRAAYLGMTPDSYVGKRTAEMLDSVEELRQRWIEAVVDASEAEGTVHSERNTTEGQAVKNMERESDFSDYDKPITVSDVEVLRSIGRKSINKFSSEDIKKAQKWAYKFYKELGTKSPFFRAWFGEWRAHDISKTQIVDTKADNRKNVVNLDTNWKIQTSKKVHKETSHHLGSTEVNAVKYLPYIDDITSKAVLFDSVISDKDNPNSLMFHTLYAYTEVMGYPALLKLQVEELFYHNNQESGELMRDYILQNIEEEPISKRNRLSRSNHSDKDSSAISISDLYDLVKTYDKDFSPAPEVSEAVLNDDGTPKVFYHGTDAEFTEFSNDEIAANEGSFFFAENREDAAAYGKNIFEVYLSGRNLADYDNQPTEFYRLKNKREQVNWLKERGYDGWYADMDSDGWGELSVFSGEQIKSATDNTGTFDSSNKDIRFSERDSDAEYLSAVERGDMETAQKMVDEAARAAGYTDKLYHGTKQFGFTAFDPSHSDDKISIFVAGSEDLAQTYSGRYGKKQISDVADVDALSIDKVVERLSQESRDSYEGAELQTEYEVMNSDDIKNLFSSVDGDIERLQDIVEAKIKVYADKLATDFNDSNYKIHKRLVELNRMLEYYLYDEISTPLYMLINHTDVFADNSGVSDIEYKIRLRNKLSRANATDGVVIKKDLDGYGVSVMSFESARQELKNMLAEGNYALYGNPKNQLVIDGKGQNWNDIRHWSNAVHYTKEGTVAERKGEFFRLYDKKTGNEIFHGRLAVNTYSEGLSADMRHLVMIDIANNVIDVRSEYMHTTREISRFAKESGYDSVKFENITDNGGLGESTGSGDVYAYFDPNNLKSADPVTYDDNGNVIPLSERFNPENKDIRYSDREDIDNEATLGYTKQKNQKGENGRNENGNNAEVLAERIISTTHRGRDGLWKQGQDPEDVYKRLADSQNDKGGVGATRSGSSGWLGGTRGDKPYVLRLGAGLLRNLRGRQLSGFDTAGRTLPPSVKKAFAESVFKNDAGDLLSLYHWTDAEFKDFAKGDIGFHLGTVDAAHKRYTQAEQRRQPSMSFYKECYVNIKNPAIINFDPISWDVFPTAHKLNEQGIITNEEIAELEKLDGYTHTKYDSPSAVELRRILERKGYDGIIYSNYHEGAISIIAFEPEQIYTVAENGIDIASRSNISNETKLKNSYRDSESFSDRSLLANALESVAQNDVERQKIAEYRANIASYDAQQQKLSELKRQIKEMSFATGPRDTDALTKLRIEARKTENRINIYDKRLLNLEATKALKDVLAREKAKAYKRAEDKGKELLRMQREKAEAKLTATVERYQESRRRGVEGRSKTEYRHKIFRVVNELNQLLTKNTKDKHIPSVLKVPVAAALDAVNMDTVGAEERITKKQAELEKARLNKNDKRIAELEREIEYIEKINDRMSEKLATLKAAYDSILESSDPLIKESYDEVISDAIDKVMGLVGDTPIRDMSLSQLEAVYNMYRMILKRVRDANKAFLASKTESITELAEGAMTELDAQKQRDKYVGKIRDLVNSFDWNNQKPIYAFLRLKSPTLLRLYNNVRHGEDVWALDISEAAKFFDDCKKKYGYKKWDFKKTYSFTSTTGKEFKLSLDQIMSVYALSKRKQADDHLRIGGFVFDETTEVKGEHGKTFKLKDSTAYKLNKEKVAEIVGALTEEQIAFVDETQGYLSDVMAEKGNEITRAMYDVELFGEKNYFPLRVAGQYLERKRDQANGDVKIKNKGFSKETTPNANAPVVLSSFSDVWAEHVNEMSMYHAFVLPLEDFYRVYNYQTVRSETSDLHGVIPSIDSAHGNGASKYIDQLLKDINGGAVTDPRETFAKRTISNFKKAAVMASMSVVVQQPTSIVRAMAIVDPKYFAKIQKLPKNKHKAKWEELKKYAPVAIIKEIGSFDTGTGRGAVEWIKGEKTFFDKADDFISRAPAYADEVTWCAIWDAVKRETLSKNQSLSPTSEEFLKIAGERFTEVITMTQVYDSTLSRSAYMRSKSVYTAMLTSFMAESTTSLNMLEYGVINKKARARMWSAAYGSILFNAVVVSFVYAMRDDDEDETFMEKYLSRLASEAVDGINPLTMMPFVKDIWSVFQGYDVERADMSLITDLAQSLERFTRALLSGENIVSSISDLLGSVSSMFGVPLRNVTRDIKAIINAFLTSWEIPDGSDIGVGVYNSVKSQIPIWNYFPDIKK